MPSDRASSSPAEVERLRAALNQAMRTMVAAHYHVAEQLHDVDVQWLMKFLADGYSAAMDALGEGDEDGTLGGP